MICKHCGWYHAQKKLFVTHNYLSYKGIRNEIEVFFSTMVSDHLFTFSLPPKFRWHDDYFRRLQLFFMYIFLAMISLHSQQIILWSDLRDVKDVNTFRFLFCFVFLLVYFHLICLRRKITIWMCGSEGKRTISDKGYMECLLHSRFVCTDFSFSHWLDAFTNPRNKHKFDGAYFVNNIHLQDKWNLSKTSAKGSRSSSDEPNPETVKKGWWWSNSSKICHILLVTEK